MATVSTNWRGGPSPYGLHRVRQPLGVLPQQAWQLDTDPTPWANEVAVEVERLNLDAASFRQLSDEHGSGVRVRHAVREIIEQRGKMHNPVTGSGGMLLGVVRQVGSDSPLELAAGDRIATLISLTLTPLRITDELAGWDGLSEQVPCQGTAILFARSIAAVLPTDLPNWLSLSILDVCGAPALTDRVIRQKITNLGRAPDVCVIGGGGKSGSLSLAAARRAGARRLVAVVPTAAEADAVRLAELADEVVLGDARNAIKVSTAIRDQVDVTVVCVDVAGCEHAAIMSTVDGGTVIFFAMATSFSAATLGAEGLAADVELLMGNGFVPGHAQFALDLFRETPGVRRLFEARHMMH